MNINDVQELRAAIELLEAKKKLHEAELIAQFHVTTDSLKPSNLIKSAVEKIMPANVLGNILKTAGTVGVGLLTSKLTGAAAGASTGKKIISTLLSQSATSAAVNNADKIKAYGAAIFNTFFKKQHKA